MRRGSIVVVVVLVFLVLAGGAFVIRARSGVTTILPGISREPDVQRAPAGVRVRVEVINTTKTRALARRATRVLRDLGYDVVEFASTGPMLDSTLVLDRSGHPAWAAAIAKALGNGARAEARPDSSRYLDVTVLLGRTWRPPSEPLDP